MPSSFSIRIFIAIALLPSCLATLHAQSTQAVSQSEIKDMSITTPESDSPFFIERQEAQAALTNAGRAGYGMYVPQPPRLPILQQVKKLYTGLFDSVKLHKGGDLLPMLLTVDPSQFSISNHPDLTISVKISNSKRQEIELLYPTDQRLEILVKDSTGNVISRWSQDRVFDLTEGFVEINPAEFIVYSEKVSTAVMKDGETYTIEASLAGQKGYTTSTTVTPTP